MLADDHLDIVVRGDVVPEACHMRILDVAPSTQWAALFLIIIRHSDEEFGIPYFAR